MLAVAAMSVAASECVWPTAPDCTEPVAVSAPAATTWGHPTAPALSVALTAILLVVRNLGFNRCVEFDIDYIGEVASLPILINETALYNLCSAQSVVLKECVWTTAPEDTVGVANRLWLPSTTE